MVNASYETEEYIPLGVKIVKINEGTEDCDTFIDIIIPDSSPDGEDSPRCSQYDFLKIPPLFCISIPSLHV